MGATCRFGVAVSRSFELIRIDSHRFELDSAMRVLQWLYENFDSPGAKKYLNLCAVDLVGINKKDANFSREEGRPAVCLAYGAFGCSTKILNSSFSGS